MCTPQVTLGVCPQQGPPASRLPLHVGFLQGADSQIVAMGAGPFDGSFGWMSQANRKGVSLPFHSHSFMLPLVAVLWSVVLPKPPADSAGDCSTDCCASGAPMRVDTLNSTHIATGDEVVVSEATSMVSMLMSRVTVIIGSMLTVPPSSTKRDVLMIKAISYVGA